MLVYYVRYIVCHVGINEAREGTVPVILVPRGCQNEGGVQIACNLFSDEHFFVWCRAAEGRRRLGQ